MMSLESGILQEFEHPTLSSFDDRGFELDFGGFHELLIRRNIPFFSNF